MRTMYTRARLLFRLRLIYVIEIGLGAALLINSIEYFAVYACFGCFLSLLFGHYLLQGWSSVNQILEYLFFGICCLLSPMHRPGLRRDSDSFVV